MRLGLKDVCLPAPSLFEENLLTVLTSHLFFNRAEIVNSLLVIFADFLPFNFNIYLERQRIDEAIV